MGEYLSATFRTDADITKADIRDALADISEDDISKSSPVSAGGSEAAVTVSAGPSGMTDFNITVDGHGGDWTKKSEEAVTDAACSVTDSVEVLDVDGGYEG
jgi:hypothetical protein